MFSKVFLSLLVVGFVHVPAIPLAVAQTCQADRTAIIQMPRKPKLGTFNIWSTSFGETSIDEFAQAGVSLPEGQSLLAGVSYTKNVDADSNASIFIRRLDHRGRKVFEYFYDSDILDVFGLLETDNGFLIFANKNKTGIWVGKIDTKGALLSAHTIDNRAGVLVGHKVISAGDDGNVGYIMTASVTPKNKSLKTYSEIYMLDSNAKFKEKKSFALGMENTLYALARQVPRSITADSQTAKNEHVFLAGSMVSGVNRNAWVMALDKSKNIAWQRSYQRGAESALYAIAPYGENNMIVAGYAKPNASASKDQAHKAGFVGLVDTQTGNVKWQRYITGKQGYEAKHIMLHDTGLISVLFNADGSEKSGEPDFIRLITLNPRGAIVENKAYMNAEGAYGDSIILGPRDGRMILGKTDAIKLNKSIISDADKMVDDVTPLVIKETQDASISIGALPTKDNKLSPVIAMRDKNLGETSMRSIDAWVMVAPRAPNYEDPCL